MAVPKLGFEKALAALVTSAMVTLASRHGLEMDAELTAAVATLATALAVYIVPNRSKA